MARRERSGRVHRQKTQHVGHFELVMPVLGEIRVKMQSDKDTFESATADKKRLLQMVGRYDNTVDVDVFVGNSDACKRKCVRTDSAN